MCIDYVLLELHNAITKPEIERNESYEKICGIISNMYMEESNLFIYAILYLYVLH